ncbi:hypothetical protein ES708_24397 [subsurface metagenome]
MFKPLYTLFYRKYWFDELYEKVIMGKILINGFFAGLEQFDVRGVDGAVNGVASGTIAAGRAIRRTQTGQLQLYGVAMAIGVVAIILCVYLVG